MDVSVVIPARNAAATIGRTLDALAAQDLDGTFEVIVVDDGSSDDTTEVVASAPLGTKLLRQDAKGPGEARNAGIEAARAPVVAFTDADCFPAPGWLREGLAAMDNADLVQGQAIPDPDAECGPFDRSIWITYDTGLYETANLFARKADLEAVGGFEDWLNPALGKRLGEDVWLGWKLRRRGARVAFASRALVHHAVFPRSGREFALERLRLVYFPDIVRRIPELRTAFLYRRFFLSRESASFDAALLGLAVATCLRPAGLAARVPPLAATVPYLRMLRRRARSVPAGRSALLGLSVAADALGFLSLLWGSARRRTPVI